MDDVSHKRADLESCPPESDDRDVVLFNLAVALRNRFKEGKKFGDLEEAITLFRDVLQLRPSGHHDRSSSLCELARCLSNRYDTKGAAILIMLYLYDLACDLRKRFQKHARMDDLKEAIELHCAALDLRLSGHPDRSSSLHELALSFSNRYDSQRAVADLEQAVILGRAAVELRLPGHPYRAASLCNLACDLRKRFQKHVRMYGLKEAIELHRAALELRPPGHPQRSLSLHGLARCLSDKYDSQWLVADLEEAITLGRAALELRLPGHPHRAVSLYNLASDLWGRFQRYARVCDLEEAIELHRAALELRLPGHHDRPVSLHELACCLSARYDSQGTVADLEEAVTIERAALEFYPPSHRKRASSLHDLARCLAKRFRRQPIAADLDEAIALEQGALQLLTPGDPSYDISRSCLMIYFQMKIDPEVASTFPRASDVRHSEDTQVVRGFVSEALKTMPTRLLHTYTGVLCNKDAQISHFMSSQQCSQLLSSWRGCPPDRRTKLIHTTISGYFKFVMFSHRWGESETLLRDIEGRSIYDMPSKDGLGKLQAF
ncbi:hypothetical protein EDD17DRAFT_1754921 [Pisolithus thermaeus]|nr:hypothetical protein EV401DRAFT_2070569 [Pisolithus croceorrhizus]KAI6164387.1 hypothetical protein EDD17DRAFT_1754921 [Pisolithus thermaeus]